MNWLSKLFSDEPPVSAVTEPVVVQEVTALLKYASERGADSECSITTPLYLATQKLTALNGARLAADPENPSLDAQALRAEIMCLYSKLAKLTYPVSGRTLVQTDTEFNSCIRPLYIWGLFFLFLVISNEMLKAWLGDLPEPEEGWLLTLLNFRRYVLDYSTPFLWGALGSIAYLLKRLSDFAEERTFDYASSRGWTTRIFLGALLGGVVQFIYDPSVFVNPEAGLKLSANALGFLTGVGVKVVYGAIEKTIDTLASKMNLNAIRTAKSDTTSIRVYLNTELAKTKEAEKQEVLLALLKDLPELKKPE